MTSELVVVFERPGELSGLRAVVTEGLAELNWPFTFVPQPFDARDADGAELGDLLVVRLAASADVRLPQAAGGASAAVRRARELLSHIGSVSFVAPQRVHAHGGQHGLAGREPLAAGKWEPPKPPAGEMVQVVDLLGVRALWAQGTRGAGVHVAIFDTGLSPGQPCLSHVVSKTDWTGDGELIDRVGHGTFMAGALGSTCECLGLAPDVRLHIYRVFNGRAESKTAWLVKALEHAMGTGVVQIINLSMGGPDFSDELFTRKVDEAVASGIIVTSGIGNSGPLWGTSLNPADQPSVVGVGSLSRGLGALARWSSRGGTKAELPDGPGRAKPDLLTVGEFWAARQGGGCQFQWGTSVSCPVVSAALALVLSGVGERQRALLNPGAAHQLLLEAATPLENSSAYESGAGSLNIGATLELARAYVPHASAFPAAVDLCSQPCARAEAEADETSGARAPAGAAPRGSGPSQWPLCTQPLHALGSPLVLNLTLLTGIAAHAQLARPPSWRPDEAAHARLLSFEYEASAAGRLWPYGGGLGLRVRATAAAHAFDGCVGGTLGFALRHTHQRSERGAARARSVPALAGAGAGGSAAEALVEVVLRLRVRPPPPRHLRLLFDLGHSLHYPRVEAPSDDNLHGSGGGYDSFDWLGDGPLTNLAGLFAELGRRGFDVDTTSEPLTEFDALQYGALVLLDPEDYYSAAEVAKVRADVLRRGLGLVVFADWHDVQLQRSLGAPVGGANVPALNAMLGAFGLALGGVARSGTVRVPHGGADDLIAPRAGGESAGVGGAPSAAAPFAAAPFAAVPFVSGSCVARAPAGTRLLSASLRRDAAILNVADDALGARERSGAGAQAAAQRGPEAPAGEAARAAAARAAAAADARAAAELDAELEGARTDAARARSSHGAPRQSLAGGGGASALITAASAARQGAAGGRAEEQANDEGQPQQAAPPERVAVLALLAQPAPAPAPAGTTRAQDGAGAGGGAASGGLGEASTPGATAAERAGARAGRIALYADSGCVDDDRALGEPCWGLVEQLVRFAAAGELSAALSAATELVPPAGFSGGLSERAPGTPLCEQVPSEGPRAALQDAADAALPRSFGRVPRTGLPPLAPFSRTAGALRACADAPHNCTLARAVVWAAAPTLGLLSDQLEPPVDAAAAMASEARARTRRSALLAPPEGASISRAALSRRARTDSRLRPPQRGSADSQTPRAELLLLPAFALLLVLAAFVSYRLCRCARGSGRRRAHRGPSGGGQHDGAAASAYA